MISEIDLRAYHKTHSSIWPIQEFLAIKISKAKSNHYSCWLGKHNTKVMDEGMPQCQEENRLHGSILLSQEVNSLCYNVPK